MNVEIIREHFLSKKDVTKSFPFNEHLLVMKVMNKIFAQIYLETAQTTALKCDPEYATELCERYREVEGTFHFNKKHWNQLNLSSDVNDRLFKKLIDHSYQKVLKKFTKKTTHCL